MYRTKFVKCVPLTVSKEMHMKHSVRPYAERLDLIMVWVVRDSAFHNVYMLATHPSGPNIESTYKTYV